MDFLKMSGIVAVVIIIEYKLARIIESWGDIACIKCSGAILSVPGDDPF